MNQNNENKEINAESAHSFLHDDTLKRHRDVIIYEIQHEGDDEVFLL